GVGWPWFTLGDLDLGTHIARTGLLRDGLSLTEVTRTLTARWTLPVELLPASDDENSTLVEVNADLLPSAGSGIVQLHFEEWWVRYRASIPALRFVGEHAETASLSTAARA